MLTFPREISQDEIDSREFVAIGDQFEGAPDDYLIGHTHVFNHEHTMHLIKVSTVEQVNHPYLPGERLIRPITSSESLQFMLDEMLDILKIRTPLKAVTVRGQEYFLFIAPADASFSKRTTQFYN